MVILREKGHGMVGCTGAGHGPVLGLVISVKIGTRRDKGFLITGHDLIWTRPGHDRFWYSILKALSAQARGAFNTLEQSTTAATVATCRATLQRGSHNRSPFAEAPHNYHARLAFPVVAPRGQSGHVDPKFSNGDG